MQKRKLSKTTQRVLLILGILAQIADAGSTLAGPTVNNRGSCDITIHWYWHAANCGSGNSSWEGYASNTILAGHSGSLDYPEGCVGGYFVDAIAIVEVFSGGQQDTTVHVLPVSQPTIALTINASCAKIDSIEPDDGDGPPDPECRGMAAWAVTDLVNLWIQDEPLGYSPSLGPRTAFRLSYKQGEMKAGYNPKVFSAGKSWNFSWLGYVTPNPANSATTPAYDIRPPLGGVARSTGTTNQQTGMAVFARDYRTRAQASLNSSQVFTNEFPDGSQDIYGFVVNSNNVFLAAYLTERRDATGQKLSFYYHDYDSADPVVRLKCVVDANGLTNWVYYVSASNYSTNLISSVVDPYGRSVTLAYNDDGELTNVTDVANLSSSFSYGSGTRVTNLTTAYGSTAFETPGPSTNAPPEGRWVRVMEPDGSCQLFLHTNGAPGVPSSFASQNVPDTAPFSNTFDNSDLHLRNTFHWDRRQYANLSTTNVAQLTAADFAIARMRRLLIESTAAFPDFPNQNHALWRTNVSSTFSLERAPSPDGTTAGQVIWYDHAGKSTPQDQGSLSLPSIVGQVLPNGSSRFTRSERNELGNTTNEVSTWSSAGAALLRTNTFGYAANGIDLVTSTNAMGVRVAGNSYNATHQVLTNYNALNEPSVYTYDTQSRLTSTTTPAGLVTTNLYFESGPGAGRLQAVVEYEVVDGAPLYYRTNSYTYTNGLVARHTDPRGLTVTNTWDALQRLRRVDYPDGTFVTNTYDKLDLVRVIDRMGFTNSFGHDSVRHRVAATNANGVVTRYGYCTCGSIEFQTNAFGTALQQVLQNVFDLQGNMVQTIGPDGYTLTYRYNAIGQLTNVTDGLSSTTNWFNNQGLLVASSNALGRVNAALFDVLDRATNTIDANSVTVTNTFDDLDRLISRGYPDGGIERFGYSARGMIAYTNQLGLTNFYAYDALRRKTAQTNANWEVTRFEYSPADDLSTLTDAKNQVTTWHTDEYGRVTNKVDAAQNVIFVYTYDPNNRLTNRWTPAKGSTAYAHDPVGNLLSIDYPASPDITLAYDVLNRLTNMVDAVGTTRYSYNAAGQLLEEDGPWADDAVSYSYQNRLRASLAVDQPNASPWTQTYAYDAAKRLTNTASPAGAFAYVYDAVRSLVPQRLSLPNGAAITNDYDGNARLLATRLINSDSQVLNSHAYGYNLANQRTRQTFTAGNYVDYTYDKIGQLQTALGTESDGTTARLHEQLTYLYDPAGNLNWRTNNALAEQFQVNSLNELTSVSRTAGSTLTVAGTTTSQATNVTVNDLAAALYGDATFAKDGFSIADGTNIFTAIAHDAYGRADTNICISYLPSSASFAYDLNGNMLSDGRRAFDYDDENQLIRITVTNQWKSEFAYDGKMRRRIRREYCWAAGSWLLASELRYLYDGNLLMQERNSWNMATVTYTRGPDLSAPLSGGDRGGFEGAGGIGGLLARTDNQLLGIGDPNAHAYYAADGNGNVIALINTNQAIVAKYIYDPYGNILSASGPLVEANLCRFSSKELHPNSGLVYYLYRYYDPGLSRWLTGDPLGEEGGVNLHAFVANDPADQADPLGLAIYGIGNMLKDPKPSCFNEGWFRHCVSSCKLNRLLVVTFPILWFSAPVTTLAVATTWGGDWPGQTGADPGDRGANYQGTVDSYNLFHSCTTLCTAQFFDKLKKECCPLNTSMPRDHPKCPCKAKGPGH